MIQGIDAVNGFTQAKNLNIQFLLFIHLENTQTLLPCQEDCGVVCATRKRINTIYYAIKQCTHIILIKAATLSYINYVYCARQTQKD